MEGLHELLASMIENEGTLARAEDYVNEKNSKIISVNRTGTIIRRLTEIRGYFSCLEDMGIITSANYFEAIEFVEDNLGM